MASKRLLVCDLDNTLYDWVGYFVPAFYAMVHTAAEILQCDRGLLLDELREVHQRHHDSEQPFSLLETTTVRQRYAGQPVAVVAKILDPAFHAFNSTRKRNLKVHDGVHETLEFLASRIDLVAHTEARLFGALDRLKRMDLLKYFRMLYCRERSHSNHPNPAAGARWLEGFPLEKVRELSHHQAKPNPDVLLEICQAERTSPEAAAYIGDSLARDILMAKRAGVFAIWAAYGASHDKSMYAALVRVSHWTPDDVARELSIRAEAATIKPDYVAHLSFREVIAALDF